MLPLRRSEPNSVRSVPRLERLSLAEPTRRGPCNKPRFNQLPLPPSALLLCPPAATPSPSTVQPTVNLLIAIASPLSRNLAVRRTHLHRPVQPRVSVICCLTSVLSSLPALHSPPAYELTVPRYHATGRSSVVVLHSHLVTPQPTAPYKPSTHTHAHEVSHNAHHSLTHTTHEAAEPAHNCRGNHTARAALQSSPSSLLCPGLQRLRHLRHRRPQRRLAQRSTLSPLHRRLHVVPRPHQPPQQS